MYMAVGVEAIPVTLPTKPMLYCRRWYAYSKGTVDSVHPSVISMNWTCVNKTEAEGIAADKMRKHNVLPCAPLSTCPTWSSSLWLSCFPQFNIAYASKYY